MQKGVFGCEVFRACEAGMLLSDKSICHFAVVLLFISPLNETESARHKTAQRAEGIKDVVSSLVKKKIILVMTKIYLHMIL